MTKMEKELIEKLERACQTEARVTLRLIRKLQKELEEKTTILLAGANKVKQLEKENQVLKRKLKEIETIVDTKPYVAYDFYGDILHEGDEILEIIRGE